MAVINYATAYVPKEDQLGIPEQSTLEGHGVRVAYAQNTVPIGATDSIGSTYCLIKNVSAEAIIKLIEIENDAITSLTSASIGIYDSQTNLPLAVSAYAAALNLSTANGKIAPLDGLAALTHANTLKCLWELAGQTLLAKKGNYDVVLTLNAAPSVGGNVTCRSEIVPCG